MGGVWGACEERLALSGRNWRHGRGWHLDTVAPQHRASAVPIEHLLEPACQVESNGADALLKPLPSSARRRCEHPPWRLLEPRVPQPQPLAPRRILAPRLFTAADGELARAAAAAAAARSAEPSPPQQPRRRLSFSHPPPFKRQVGGVGGTDRLAPRTSAALSTAAAAQRKPRAHGEVVGKPPNKGIIKMIDRHKARLRCTPPPGSSSWRETRA